MSKAQKDASTEQGEQPRKPIPWWVSILLAIGVYCTLKYILPELKPSSQGLQDLFQMGPVAAPVMTIPFLLLAAKQLYDTDIPESEIEEDEEDKEEQV